MFITEAFAQTAGAPSTGGADILMSILPFLLIFVVMYFLIIRPQRAPDEAPRGAAEEHPSG